MTNPRGLCGDDPSIFRKEGRDWHSIGFVFENNAERQPIRDAVVSVNDIEALSRFTANSQWADLAGHIAYDKQHREVFNFGKHKGKPLEEVFTSEPAYYDWIIKSDFPLYTKALVTEVWKRLRDKKLRDLKLHFGQ